MRSWPARLGRSTTATPTFAPFGKENRMRERGGNAYSDCEDEGPYVMTVLLSH